MEEVRPNDWAELQRALYENTWNAALKRFRSNFVYRGMGNASFDLRTSLMQLGGDYAELEAHLLRNFKKYASQDAVHENNEWNWLALAQHHGLPTRLLDWTYSPYVALHFATIDLKDYDCDGVIWSIDYVQAHSFLPSKLKEVLSRESANAFTAEMLIQAAQSLQAIGTLSRKPFVVFLEPPSLDARIVNQFALFSFMSQAGVRLDEWLAAQHKTALARRIIIPRGFKWEVRDKLDQANITERVLMPGLDGLSRWLKRHYTPRT